MGADCRIGDGVELKSGVSVYPGTRIGAACTTYENAVLGRPPQGTSAMTRKIRDDLQPLTIGEGCVIGACAVLYCGTTIGNQVLIGDLASIREQCRIGDNCIVARGVTVNYNTQIGNRVKIMDNTHITGNMVIEDDVFVSCLVATTNDVSLDRDRAGHTDYPGPVLRRGASIGALASLLPGVEVGEFAIVASGAVVVRPVPPRKVVAGAPARVVRTVRSDWLPESERRPLGGDAE